MTVLTTTLSREDLELLEAVHGHLCPMVLLAARVAKRARLCMSGIGEGLPFGFYRGHGCAVDGIQIFSRCTIGNANLVLLRGRDHSFLLTMEEADEGILVSPLPETLKEVRDPNGRDTGSLMKWLGGASDEELFRAETVSGLGILTRFPGQ